MFLFCHFRWHHHHQVFKGRSGRRFCSTHDVKEPSCKISNSDMDHFSLLGQEQIALALLLFTLGKNVIFR